MTAAGVLVAIGGAVSVVLNTFAAIDERAFTVSLGGLLLGLGCGVTLAGFLLLRRSKARHVTAGLCVGIILTSTIAGYVAGGVLDNALR